MSGSQVPFVTTLSNLRIPLASFEIGTGTTSSQQPQRSLLIGYPAAALPMVPMLVSSTSLTLALVGAQSMLGRMVQAYIANDPDGELWILPVPVNTGDVDAVETLSITGTATGVGTIALYAGGQRLAVSVGVGDTAQVITNEFAAAIAPGLNLPVRSPAVAAGTATAATLAMTAFHYSLRGNDIDYRINYGGALAGESIPAGIAVSLASTSAGAGTPTLAGLAAALGQQTYDFICTGFPDSNALGVIQTLLSDTGGRWSPSLMEYGHVWTSAHGVASTVQTLGANGDAENDRHTTLLGSSSPTPPWEHMAAVMGSCATSLRNDPARPLQGLQVIGPLAPAAVDSFNRNNQQYLLTNGVALCRWDHAGNCFVERMVTTYQFDTNGNADQSYLDTETLYTLMLFVRTLKSALESSFPRSKLADNGTHFGEGLAITTPNDIRNEIVAQYAVMETQGLTEDTAAFTAGLIVKRNTSDASRVDVLLDPYFVSGLRILASLVNFYLNTPTS